MAAPRARDRSAAAALGLALGLAAAGPAAAETLRVPSWGGIYQQSQEEAVFGPWMERTGHRVALESGYSGGLAEVRAQVAAGEVTWQTLIVAAEDALLGCREGLLEPLDASRLPPAPDGRSAAEDFIDGGLLECGVGSEAYSLVFAYDRERLPEGPARIQDFFDLEKYPGKRGLRRAAVENLELALAADGVPVERVYDVLRAAGGADRAFAKLDAIREHVVWWEDSGEAPRLLAGGEVLMTTIYNGRAFDAVVVENRPFAIVWDAQVYKLAYHVIPRGAPHKELAMDLIAFATSTEVAADQYSRIPYMPLRQSAMERIGAYHMDPDLNLWPYMPLVPENTQNAVRLDAEFWLDYKTELTARFRAWLEER